jgi:hypothetical protein
VIDPTARGAIRVLDRSYDWLEPQLPETASYDLYQAWKDGDREPRSSRRPRRSTAGPCPSHVSATGLRGGAWPVRP